MSTNPNPTLIFVHGAWFPASCWDKVIVLLSPTYPCKTASLPSVTHPSSSSPSTTDGTFLDDITAVRNAIQSETVLGHDVILVVHSYGALPAHSAAKGLTLPSSPGSDDKKGYVLGFAMLTTGFTVTGMAFLDPTGGVPPPSWRADMDSNRAVLVADPRELFFHDLSPAEAED